MPKLDASGATIGRCFKYDLATEAKLGKTVAVRTQSNHPARRRRSKGQPRKSRL
jgi:hypothetical protein